MATMAGFNKTSQNDLIEGVDISAIILGMNVQASVYQDIAWINPAMTKEKWRIVRDDVITVNATLAETDEATPTSFTTSSVEITPAVYPVRGFVSLELEQDSAVDALSKAIANHAEVIKTAIDVNVLANISSATNTSDYNGTALDKDKFLAARLAFDKQKPNAGPQAFVGGYKQIADIIGAFADAGGSVYAVPGLVSNAVASKGDSSVYFKGNVAGMDLYAGAVPASGGADVSGAFLVVGKALAIGFKVLIDYKIDPAPGRVGVDLMTFSRYGTGIASQANLREVISLA